MTGVLHSELAESLAATEFPATVPSIDQPDAGVTPEMKDFGARCLNPPDPSDAAACTFVPPDPNGRTVVIIGDSIAAAWLPGVREALAPEGYTVHAVTFSRCPPAEVDWTLDPAPWQPACETGRAAALDQLDRLEPDLVIGSVHQDACGGPLQRPADCVTSSYGSFDATLYAFSDAAEQGDFGFVDTTSWCCVETSCPIFAAGRLIRWDEAHLTNQVATYLAPLLGEHLTYELTQRPGAAKS